MSRRDIASETLSIQPLKLNHKLFENGDVADAMIGRGMWLNQQSYQDGYIGSAITLLDLIKLSDKNEIKDSYIIVALFCFRQYLELSMKDSLIHYYKSEKLGELVYESGHNLEDLFEKIMELPQMEPNETSEAVKQMINTIQGYDPTGVVFRYPYSIDKATGQIKPLLKPGIGLKSVKALRKRMLQLYEFFDGINSMVHDYERKGIIYTGDSDTKSSAH